MRTRNFGRIVNIASIYGLFATALVALLCGPAGADITGTAIPIDGGWSAS
jgi:NAD(P)-dependent dehydrogenase (short-subunit alcohol dehydrogenase family)